MTGARPERLTFSPALSCVDCKQDTNRGLIYPMSSLAWQHLPLCDEHDEGEGAAMMRELYADNYEERRLEILLRAAGRCENVIDGQCFPHGLGTVKMSRAYNPFFEQLFIHHPNNDPWNPNAVMIAVCASCHMKLYRKPEANGKVPARKQGYKVVSITHLLSGLAGVGFRALYTEECRVSWRFEQCAYEAEAADMLDALAMCLHWLGAEVRDLQEALAQAEQRRLTDMVTRVQAEERRLCDAALRGAACCIEGDRKL